MKKILVFFLFSITCFGQNETTGVIISQITTQFELRYILNKPDHHKPDMPLIIFLHGSGEKGSDLEKIKSHGPLKYLKTNKIGAYVLAPQCPEGRCWDSEELYLLIKKLFLTTK